jgi:hypothetical protein
MGGRLARHHGSTGANATSSPMMVLARRDVSRKTGATTCYKLEFPRRSARCHVVLLIFFSPFSAAQYLANK